MDTLYTTGHLHGFPSTFNISSSTSSFYNPIGSSWGSQEGVVALGVVLGSSVSLVALAFSFITYRYVSSNFMSTCKDFFDINIDVRNEATLHSYCPSPSDTEQSENSKHSLKHCLQPQTNYTEKATLRIQIESVL